jgi:polysaccharide export outer membrane protein
MKKKSLFALLLILVVTISSCISTKKSNYFDNQVPGVQLLDSTKPFSIQRIKANDRLNIVISSTDPSLTAYLNPNTFNNNNNLGGYLVNSEGSIEFPLLGKIPFEGLTTVEASLLLKEKLSYYYKDLYVNISLLGKVYFITGRSGGNIPIQNERLTIFEAIAQMPSLDAYDQKNDVWIIREDSGKRFYSKIDLNNKKIFDSHYFYLKNNDLIYIKSGKFSNTWFNTSSSPVKAIITIFGTILGLFFALRNL